MRATTDSEPAVDPANMGAGIANLLTIGAGMRSRPSPKKALPECATAISRNWSAEAVIARLGADPAALSRSDRGSRLLESVLTRGREHVLPIAEDTVRKTKRAMGLYA